MADRRSPLVAVASFVVDHRSPLAVVASVALEVVQHNPLVIPLVADPSLVAIHTMAASVEAVVHTLVVAAFYL